MTPSLMAVWSRRNCGASQRARFRTLADGREFVGFVGTFDFNVLVLERNGDGEKEHDVGALEFLGWER